VDVGGEDMDMFGYVALRMQGYDTHDSIKRYAEYVFSID
jgi:hypothetical protein